MPPSAAAAFDLDAFCRALRQGDVEQVLSCYSADADVRVVDPDNPPEAPSRVRGTRAIRAWLVDAHARELDLVVTHQVDGGDRVAFTQSWHYQDGTIGQATSTAELVGGLITTQHTILVWGDNWS